MKDYAELKALIETCGVHEQLGPAGKGYGIEQNPHELATFLVRMQELGVQSVLEIGTGYKAGLARFLAHRMKWQVTTLDIHNYGHPYPDIRFFILTDDGQTWTHLEGKGYTRHSIASIQKYSHYDLVFIDGAHDYDSVKHDYETYGGLATKSIAFHDIAGLRDCEGAQKFWWELPFKGIGQKNLWIIDEEPQCAGIGWIEL